MKHKQKKIQEEGQRRLKLVQSYEDYIVFEKWLKSENLYLVAKNGVEALDFNLAYNFKKARYLLDDGKTVRICRWENLYKYLSIRGLDGLYI